MAKLKYSLKSSESAPRDILCILELVRQTL